MANAFSKIGIVEKRELGSKILYIFPTATVEVQGNAMQFYYSDLPVARPKDLQNDIIQFDSLTDKQGRSSAVDYVENYLIPNRFFFDSSATAVDDLISADDVRLSRFEEALIKSLGNVMQELIEIKYYIQGISE